LVRAPESGQRICNRYVLLERIGSGGHGEIWSATDEQDGQKVALKFLREDLGASVEAWAILNHESQMARRLNHPGILRSGTPIREGERTVLPMEFAGGGDLRRLRGQSYLRSVPVLIRIAEILAHAHARGVVHRDLKPGNVLFDSQGGVRLADFGASGLSGSKHSHAQGSLFTASPQQLQDLPAAPADDIYGLGALAYELLSGQPPYFPQVTRERVLAEPVPELVAAQPAPARLVALIMRMLEKEPDLRPPSMSHVVEGLNQALSDTLIVDQTEPDSELRLPAAPIAPSVPGFEGLRAERRVVREKRLLPAAAWVGGLGVLAGLVLALWILHPWRRPVLAPEPTENTPPAAAAAPAAMPAPAEAPEPVTAATLPTERPAAVVPPAGTAAPVAPPDTRVTAECTRHVARGQEALQVQRLTDARAAFGRCLALQPDEATARAGVEQVDAALAADEHAGLRREGLALEGQERWHEARDAYQRALQKDATLRFAQQGAQRAGERAELSERLDVYLSRPGRLDSAAIRGEARLWLSRARLLEQGPVLRSQIDRVELLLQDYEPARKQ
jgi:tetratricopeptide (TPR) repeat protein